MSFIYSFFFNHSFLNNEKKKMPATSFNRSTPPQGVEEESRDKYMRSLRYAYCMVTNKSASEPITQEPIHQIPLNTNLGYVGDADSLF